MQKAAVCLLADLCIVMLGRQNNLWRHVHWSPDNSLGWRVDIMLHASTLLSTPQQHVFAQQGFDCKRKRRVCSCTAVTWRGAYCRHGDVLV